MSLGIAGTIHPKDDTGFIGAEISELGLFTQAKTLRGLEKAIKGAFEDLFEKEIELEVSFIDEIRFVLSSSDAVSFYGLILKGMRGDRSYREAGEALKQKSTAALQRYERGETEPGLQKAIEMVQGFEEPNNEHVLVFMRKTG